MFKERDRTEVGERGAEKDRRQLALGHQFHVECIACALNQFNLIAQGGEVIAGDLVFEFRPEYAVRSERQGFGLLAGFIKVDFVLEQVIDALEVHAVSDRPGDRDRRQTQYVL